MSVIIRESSVALMGPLTLYAILKVRVDVFVLEQGSAYQELDGRDIEPGAVIVWAEEDRQVLSTLRILIEDDSRRIGRVATAASGRGRGLGADLIRHAIRITNGARIILDAQEHLEGWYENFGFLRSGESFLEDGISHIPMTRPPSAPELGEP
ncbi:GNAT family N-acetyltransferase [Arthrobacter sp. StoSoilB5]|uniref:GNAT family N-acetyltransferase n=1 Tax=Arthrobacter sp. StoSoilB5 TaxID=2830992 RepID=UPI001CC55504|nr:GNAT family N-acetyltransferase [Arthrobacter sp. StoSoilB5]BCW44730.1 ElaA protein [Arthrobacter sp. StoSoilB5]